MKIFRALVREARRRKFDHGDALAMFILGWAAHDLTRAWRWTLVGVLGATHVLLLVLGARLALALAREARARR